MANQISPSSPSQTDSDPYGIAFGLANYHANCDTIAVTYTDRDGNIHGYAYSIPKLDPNTVRISTPFFEPGTLSHPHTIRYPETLT